MKYVMLVNEINSEFNRIRQRINLGDNIQSFSIYNLLKNSGVYDREIQRTSMFSHSYFSEPCKVIMQGHFSRIIQKRIFDDPNTIPIFLGFGLMDSYLSKEEISYYKKYQPILCRDEFTKNIMIKNGIEAYLSGCMSLLVDRLAQHEDRDEKYYFVDVSDNIINQLPEEIKKVSVFTTQNIPYIGEESRLLDDGDDLARKRLIDYCRHAKAIFTSKLHCMCPAVGMGIPTFAVGKNLSYRYGFVDAFLTCYYKTLSVFDWTEEFVKLDVSDIKKMLMTVGISMIKGVPDMGTIKKIDAYYSKRKKWDYCPDIKRLITQFFGDDNRPSFIIWGASAGGYTVYNCIKELYPSSCMKDIVDSYAQGIWEGKKIKKPEEICLEKKNVKVVIATLSGRKMAEKYLSERGKTRDKDYCFIHESM